MDEHNEINNETNFQQDSQDTIEKSENEVESVNNDTIDSNEEKVSNPSIDETSYYQDIKVEEKPQNNNFNSYTNNNEIPINNTTNNNPYENTQTYNNGFNNQNPYQNMNNGRQNYYQNNNFNNPYGNNQNFNYNPYINNPPKIKYNPYTGQYEAVNKEPIKTSTIIYISVIAVLSVLLLVSLILFASSKSSNKYQTPKETDDYYSYFFGDDMPEISNNSKAEYETYSVEIELEEDKGNTQIKENDKKDNSYPADEKAENLKAVEKHTSSENNSSSETAYEKVTPSVVGVICYKDKITDEKSDIVGEGTGTIISKNGYIMTNSHVIGDSKEYVINIKFSNGDEKVAKIVGYDSRTDIAILKVDSTDLSPVTFFSSSLVKVGEDVIAIGNPGGVAFQNSLTKGIVSFVGREITSNDMVKYIQSDASVNPGNSGGPLCNIYGEVIGITTAKISSTEYEGMSFSIPSDTAIEIANDLIHYGYVRNRVRLGLSGVEVSQQQISMYNLPEGIIVEEISEDGPLNNKGVNKNDILVSVDGKKVSSFQNVYAILETHKPGDKIELVFSTEKK